MKTNKWYLSPYVAQSVSIAQYTIKATLKIVIGGSVASSMIKGDGFHNLADIVPAVIVMLGVWIRRRRWSGYPFQLKEVESILTLAIGGLLGWTGLKIGWDSFLGCLSLNPTLDIMARQTFPLPVHEAVHVDAKLLMPLVALMGGSALVSLLLASYQIHVGKVSGETALVADGKETMTDGTVELVGLVGVVLVQRFHLPAAEYVLGFVVMAFVLHTAWEIFKPSLDAILKRSLGEELEAQLREHVLATAGVEGIRILSTFRFGRTTPVCLITVVTRLEANRHASLRKALARVIRTCLMATDDAREAEIRIDFAEPETNAHRVAYACRREGERIVIVHSRHDATHLLIGDMRQNDTLRSRFRLERITTDVMSSACEKKVETIFFHRGGNRTLPQDQNGVRFKYALFSDPETELGVPLFRS